MTTEWYDLAAILLILLVAMPAAYLALRRRRKR